MWSARPISRRVVFPVVAKRRFDTGTFASKRANAEFTGAKSVSGELVEVEFRKPTKLKLLVDSGPYM